MGFEDAHCLQLVSLIPAIVCSSAYRAGSKQIIIKRQTSEVKFKTAHQKTECVLQLRPPLWSLRVLVCVQSVKQWVLTCHQNFKSEFKFNKKKKKKNVTAGVSFPAIILIRLISGLLTENNFALQRRSVRKRSAPRARSPGCHRCPVPSCPAPGL